MDEEEKREFEQRYSRRQLGSNVDRYVEPEPELDSEGEEVVEPEVDISSLLERQRLSPGPSVVSPASDEDDDVDKSLAHIGGEGRVLAQSKKGRVQQIEWDAELEELSREKAAAEATRDLKARFRAQTARQRGRGTVRGGSHSGRGAKHLGSYAEAPPLPTDAPKPEKNEKEDMQDYLDDLLG
ncbi:hypothetical protein K466DRAFT_594841 [Polyporus arcularius HHB13444]|uniref:Uncharacterized protein n=1 Tax=Polyporus arcularius HHB13444 TaxID=1314778 RepID=A0A5C3PTE3_9APHY|nr:hypothetical protein K466DRAFT_594841 [Polyporus arcularius HHB13444]